MHFEARNLSLTKGIVQLGFEKVLEFSSGLSLRGLELCRNPRMQYIDTDLPSIIEIKRELSSRILKDDEKLPSNLVLTQMNALDEKEFFETVATFNQGPITLVNEGLLMYLDRKQKSELCGIIHDILTRYGGYWITADIYIRDEEERKGLNKHYNQSDKDFVKKHNIDANKFSSFEEAETFFKESGFEIYTKIEVENEELSSYRLLEQNDNPSDLPQTTRKTRETWILKAI